MQRTALRAAADAERSPRGTFILADCLIVVMIKHAVVFYILMASIVHAAEQSEVPGEKDRALLLRTVVLLSTPTTSSGTENESERTIGTAFLLRVTPVKGDPPIPSGKERLFLVTAEHVANNTNAQTQVVVSTDDDRPQSFPLTSWARGRMLDWTVHGVADVALLELDPPTELTSDLYSRAFFGEHLGRLESPNRDRPTLTIGFPLGLGITYRGPDARVSPITREAKPISGLLTLARFDNHKQQTFFLLENPSVGGFSGSPVYLFPTTWIVGRGMKSNMDSICIGLIHGTLKDKGEGRFAAVVPSQYIIDTLIKALNK